MRSLSGLALAVTFLIATSDVAAQTKRRPNLILVVADDLGYGDLGSYGQTKIKTPHLDALAKEGMRFTQFYSGSPVCAPSRCVLMTGLHSGHAYIRDNREAKPEGQLPIPAETVTLPRLLREAGYRTGLFGKWGLGMFGTSGDPLRHGFETFFGYNCQRHAHSFYPPYLYKLDQKITLEGNDGAKGTHSHGLIEAEVMSFVRKHKDEPFFLYLPSTLPHLALQIPDDDLKAYDFPETPYEGGKGYRPHPRPRAAYAAMVGALDRTVGRLVALLKELGIDDNTVIAFTSDNGAVYAGIGGSDPAFFRSNGPLRDFKGSMFEGGIRVPFLVRWPGRFPAGQTSPLACAAQDVLPTLCEIAGVKAPKVDGLSLVPTLTGKGTQAKHASLYFEFAGYGGQQSVLVDNWKAVRFALNKADSAWQLYDLATDLGQTKDVAASQPEVMARIRRIAVESRTPAPQFVIPALDGVPFPAPKKKAKAS